jgi:DNA repair protein RadC
MKEKYTIMEIPKDERPREKLLKYGAKSLTNSELIGILLRVGSNKDTAITLGQKILKENEKGLLNLVNATPGSLNKFHGVSNAKAATILAAVELGKRISSTKASESFKITSPQDVSALVMEDMRYYKKEYIITISIGSLNSSIVHPREVFLEAVKKSSASIILLHNHPSGEVQPSREDINITQRLIEAGDIMGIKVLDHIIIGDGTYLSFKEENII